MILICCVDNRLGLAFNRRRLSRDSAVYADIAVEAGAAPVWMDVRSTTLFKDTGIAVRSEEGFAEKAGEGEYCFVEFFSPAALERKIEKIILYRWNRHYPSDTKFDISLNGWTLETSYDFPGSSHEAISKEIYNRV